MRTGGRGKHNSIFSCGAFRKAKYEIRRRRKRGWAKIPSLQPPSFLPARAFSFGSAARSAAIRDFVQKRFELRSVIATFRESTKRMEGWVCAPPPAQTSAKPRLNSGTSCRLKRTKNGNAKI